MTNMAWGVGRGTSPSTWHNTKKWLKQLIWTEEQWNHTQQIKRANHTLWGRGGLAKVYHNDWNRGKGTSLFQRKHQGGMPGRSKNPIYPSQWHLLFNGTTNFGPRHHWDPAHAVWPDCNGILQTAPRKVPLTMCTSWYCCCSNQQQSPTDCN